MLQNKKKYSFKFLLNFQDNLLFTQALGCIYYWQAYHFKNYAFKQKKIISYDLWENDFLNHENFTISVFQLFI